MIFECFSLRISLRAGVAQSVERELPKLEVAGSRPVARSNASKFEPATEGG